MRVVVTGSSGLTGARLMKALHNRGDRAVPFDVRRDSAPYIEDICDADAIVPALAGADGVIHLAAISRVAWGEQRPKLCERVNVGGTSTLLAALARLRSPPWIVFASS